MNHRWNGTVCKNCQLIRKEQALTDTGKILHYGQYIYRYLVNDKWQNERPDCIPKKSKKDDKSE